ncbi:DUF3488 and transglutaminase-like domain-containing protein [Actinoplanes sp. CA-015351]|uniref:DUF3488 and transglutaminase-like domain-containing protein n=1 Tax=Actinoplanes sp. CA-015351 TaxID=3239897 RepID=UPI003D9981EB
MTSYRVDVVGRLATVAAASGAGLTFAPAFEPSAGISLAVSLTAVAVAILYPRHLLAVPTVLAGPIVSIAVLRQPVDLATSTGADGWARIATVVRDGPGDLLRLTLPLPPHLALIATLWTAAAAAATAVLLQRRPGGLESLLPSAAVGVLGVVASGLGAAHRTSLLLGMAAVGLLIAGNVRRVALYSRARSAAAFLAVVVAAVPLWWLPNRTAADRNDPRDWFSRSAGISMQVDLLDQVGGWLSAPPEDVLFTAEAGPVRQWRLAVLDRYDSQTWTSSATFSAAGLGVPPNSGPIREATVQQRIEIRELDCLYLPAADRPVRVSGAVGAVDASDGVLLATKPPGPGTRYQVTSLASLEPIPTKSEPAAAGTSDELAVPEILRDDVSALLRQAPLRAGMPAAQSAGAVLWYLRNHRRNVTGIPSTAGAAAMAGFLIGGRPGTTVQFAVAFALAMRQLGIPARLVVGFAASTHDTAGTVNVRGRDARVWVQLKYVAAGWVTYDPTPPATTAEAPPPPAEQPPPDLNDPPPTVALDPAAPVADRADVGRIWPLALIILIAAVFSLGIVLIAPPVRRFWWRHRGGTPDQQVIRAWRDVLGQCAPITEAPSRTLTPGMLYEVITARSSEANVAGAQLALLADQALYSPFPCSQDDAGAAWQSAAVVRRALRRSRTRRERLRYLFRLPIRR